MLANPSCHRFLRPNSILAAPQLLPRMLPPLQPSFASSLVRAAITHPVLLPLLPAAGTSAHQQENAIRLVHVCLATLMKVGLPKAVAMETQVAVSALHESLFSQGEHLLPCIAAVAGSALACV